MYFYPLCLARSINCLPCTQGLREALRSHTSDDALLPTYTRVWLLLYCNSAFCPGLDVSVICSMYAFICRVAVHRDALLAA